MPQHSPSQRLESGQGGNGGRRGGGLVPAGSPVPFGFADFEVSVDEGLKGFGYGYYTYVLPHEGSYHLNVGCDGSPQQLGMTVVTPEVSGSGWSFDCNDVNTVLKAGAGWAFSRVLGQWVKALDLTHGIAYKRCEAI